MRTSAVVADEGGLAMSRPDGGSERLGAHESGAAKPSSNVHERAVWEVLARVPDPEIPVLSIVDLGIVRHVATDSAGRLRVGITPTYSGCPATEVIRRNVREALDQAGLSDAVLEEVLSPPWTSDWLSEEGRRKLQAFGIAPPSKSVSSPRRLLGEPAVICPRCGSRDTQRLSEFGSTPCKAHYRCAACLEPFDHFKCI